MFKRYKGIGLSVVIGLFLISVSTVQADFIDHGLYPNDAVGYWSFDGGNRTDLSGSITNGGIGFFFETGLNVGKFVQKDLLISPYVGLATVGNAQYASGFQQAVNEHYQTPQAYTDLTNRNTMLEPYTEEDLLELQAY
jgi:hypothetical protein